MQKSQTLTGVSQPRNGTGFLVIEQSSQTPLPHSRQWCRGINGPKGFSQQMHRSHSLSGIQYVGLAVSLMMPFGISKTEATAEMELTTTSPYFRALKITIFMCRYVMQLLNNFKSYLKYIIKLNKISKIGQHFVAKPNMSIKYC